MLHFASKPKIQLGLNNFDSNCINQNQRHEYRTLLVRWLVSGVIESRCSVYSPSLCCLWSSVFGEKDPSDRTSSEKQWVSLKSQYNRCESQTNTSTVGSSHPRPSAQPRASDHISQPSSGVDTIFWCSDGPIRTTINADQSFHTCRHKKQHFLYWLHILNFSQKFDANYDETSRVCPFQLVLPVRVFHTVL